LINNLSRKSNNSKEGMVQLFALISEVHQLAIVSDSQLLLLNQRIENFYQNKL